MSSEQNQQKDYYAILGVMREASADEISAAYYGLVQKYHPDVGQGGTEAMERLKLINEAYETLSDSDKRRQYDRLYGGSAGRRSRRVPVTSGPIRRRPRRAVKSLQPIELEVPVAPEEARHGGPCRLKLSLPVSCSSCDGHGRRGADSCPDCSGSGMRRRQQMVDLLLPPQLADGTLLRLPAHLVGADVAATVLLRIRIRPYW